MCQNRLLVEHQPSGQFAMEPEMPPLQRAAMVTV